MPNPSDFAPLNPDHGTSIIRVAVHVIGIDERDDGYCWFHGDIERPGQAVTFAIEGYPTPTRSQYMPHTTSMMVSDDLITGTIFQVVLVEDILLWQPIRMVKLAPALLQRHREFGLNVAFHIPLGYPYWLALPDRVQYNYELGVGNGS